MFPVVWNGLRVVPTQLRHCKFKNEGEFIPSTPGEIEIECCRMILECTLAITESNNHLVVTLMYAAVLIVVALMVLYRRIR